MNLNTYVKQSEKNALNLYACLNAENMQDSSTAAGALFNQGVPPRRQAPSPQQTNHRGRRKHRGNAHNLRHYVMPRSLQPTLDNSPGLYKLFP